MLNERKFRSSCATYSSLPQCRRERLKSAVKHEGVERSGAQRAPFERPGRVRNERPLRYSITRIGETRCYCRLPNVGRCRRSQDRVFVNCPSTDVLYLAKWMTATHFCSADIPFRHRRDRPKFGIEQSGVQDNCDGHGHGLARTVSFLCFVSFGVPEILSVTTRPADPTQSGGTRARPCRRVVLSGNTHPGRKPRRAHTHGDDRGKTPRATNTSCVTGSLLSRVEGLQATLTPRPLIPSVPLKPSENPPQTPSKDPQKTLRSGPTGPVSAKGGRSFGHLLEWRREKGAT